MSTNSKKFSQVIDALGGSAKVARDLGLDPTRGVQRVNNWKERGIPPAILLDHSRYFSRVKSLIKEAKAA
jgi:hypothetical protein